MLRLIPYPSPPIAAAPLFLYWIGGCFFDHSTAKTLCYYRRLSSLSKMTHPSALKRNESDVYDRQIRLWGAEAQVRGCLAAGFVHLLDRAAASPRHSFKSPLITPPVSLSLLLISTIMYYAG